MSRSRVVLDLLSARAAARQSRERPWAPSQPGSLGIRNRPALPSSLSTSTGKSQPAHCIRSGKAALQPTSSSPKVQSRPLHTQPVQIAPSPKSRAKSVMDRLQARRERLATTARPTLDKASVTPGTTTETWMTLRQRHDSHRRVGASHEKQARPTLRSRARQASPETLLIESLFPSSQSSSESSITTGRSFLAIAPTTPRRNLRPLMPQAPRPVKFREAGIRAVSFPALVKSTKALPKGILKKAGSKDRSTAKRAVTWAGELEKVAVVDRWIGCSVDLDSPEKVQQATAAAKALDVHPDPTRYLGKLWGWTGPDGEDDYIFGEASIANHAECRSPDCNKRTLHQYHRRSWWHAVTGDKQEHLPLGEPLQIFNKRQGYSWSSTPRSARRYPKERGLVNFDD
ncbi:MAG: hypothetical protein LQ343_003688 [Gyalolechia ehrenbergii]|nr:MAG: hypothetical protein LQ343_003688 [Gyalolechia ehrenbergii]